jgi:hypothetical protein
MLSAGAQAGAWKRTPFSCPIKPTNQTYETKSRSRASAHFPRHGNPPKGWPAPRAAAARRPLPLPRASLGGARPRSSAPPPPSPQGSIRGSSATPGGGGGGGRVG